MLPHFVSYNRKSLTQVSNRQVVGELKAGNPAGCRHLVDWYQDRLMGEATNVFHVPFVDAEEVVNDVLLTVVNRIGDFEFKRTDGDFHFWVMTIFRNRVRDFTRKRAMTEGLIERFSESDGDGDVTGPEQDVLRAIVRDYEQAARSEEGGDPGGKLEVVQKTLESMESWERVLLRCRALGVPFSDIEQYTGKPAKTLKVYHARVKKKFVSLLAEHYPELQESTQKG